MLTCFPYHKTVRKVRVAPTAREPAESCDLMLCSHPNEAAQRFFDHFELLPASVPKRNALVVVDQQLRDDGCNDSKTALRRQIMQQVLGQQARQGGAIGVIAGSYPSARDFAKEVWAATEGRATKPRVLVFARDFEAQWKPRVQACQWHLVGALMLAGALRLIEAGADVLCMPALTPHNPGVIKVLLSNDEVARRLVSITDATASHVIACGFERVAVLGTRYVMTEEYLPAALDKLLEKVATSAKFIFPRGGDFDALDSLCWEALMVDEFHEKDARMLNEIIERMRLSEGCDAVALACTEIPMLYQITQVEPALPALDPLKILVKSCVERVTVD